MISTAIAAPSPVQLLARACAAEWTRLWSVRATWWCLLAAAITIIGIGAAAAADAVNDPDGAAVLPPAWVAGELAVLPGQFALLVLVLLAVTPEYATGAIGTTLQWTPRRSILLAARTIVPVAVATVAGVVLALVADLAAWLILPGLEMSVSGVAGSLGTIAGVLAAGSILAVGAGLLLRSTAGGMAAVFMLLLVLPFILPAFGVTWMLTLAELLPGSASAFFLVGEPDMTTASAIGVFAAWAGAAIAAGGLSLLRRDAT